MVKFGRRNDFSTNFKVMKRYSRFMLLYYYIIIYYSGMHFRSDLSSAILYNSINQCVLPADTLFTCRCKFIPRKSFHFRLFYTEY